MRPHYLRKCGGGEYYLLPAFLKDEFDILQEAIDNEEEHSEKWYEFIDLFNNKFADYQVEGELFDTVLYLH